MHLNHHPQAHSALSDKHINHLLIMNLRHLKHIVAVADTLNFHRASERVFLTQSALSRSVANFENEIGLKVFERTNSHVAVTYVGQQILARARKLINEANSFRQELDSLNSGESGQVNFGMGPFLAATIIPDALKHYHLQHPNITFDLYINGWTHLSSMLEQEEIEFFIADIRQIPNDPRFSIQLLSSPSIGFYCCPHHPLYTQSGGRRINPAQMLEYPLASVAIPTVVKAEIKQALGLSTETLNFSIQCEDLLLLKNLLPDTHIILLCANNMITSSQDRNSLKKLNIPLKNDRFGTWGLVKLEGKDLSPAAMSLSTSLCDHILAVAEITTQDLEISKI